LQSCFWVTNLNVYIFQGNYNKNQPKTWCLTNILDKNIPSCIKM
jgi:hypothetical protein